MKRPIEAKLNNKRIKLLDSTKELGIIESICLRNFMCHDNLTFDFDPHINFIIGQNGSGKSAILAGIILALGGKSSSTARYSNIRGFIKTGKQKAFLSVTLKNGGDFAYKPELYGEKIIVEREISIDGVSGYKLKSAAGRIISTLKEELINILNAMDIQIENPVLILTQEISRNFLMSKHGKEEKLYELFYRGTGLQRLEENYQISMNTRNEAANEMVAKGKIVQDLEKEVKHWKKLFEATIKIKDLRNELLWARIIEMEKMVEEKAITREKLLKSINTYKKESENCKEVYNKECLSLETYLKERNECDKKMDSLRKLLEELSSQRDSQADVLRKHQGELDRFKRQESKQLEDIAGLEKSILDSELKNQSDLLEQKQKREEKICELERNNLDITTKQEDLKKEHDRVFQEQNDTRHALDSLKAEQSNLEYKNRNLKQDIERLTKAMQNKNVLFGEQTSAVLAEINRRSQEFIKRPKGPIGLDLGVRDPKWNNAVEACLKPAILRSFCCDNYNDSKLLTDILKKYYPKSMPSVITSKFLSRVHDVSQHRARTQYPTVLDMLMSKDPDITNCLIDESSIENVILIEDITTAQTVMLDNPPKNCKSAFLQNCDEILLNPYRHYSSTKKLTNSMLQSVDQNRIRAVQKERNYILQEIQSKVAQIAEKKQMLQRFPAEIMKLESEFVKLQSLISKNMRIINDLKQHEEVKDITGMQDDLLAFKLELRKKKEEIRLSEQNVSKLKADYQETIEKLRKQKELLQTEKSKFDTLGQKLNECGKNKEVLASGKREYESTLKKAEIELKQVEEDLRKAKEATQIALDAANVNTRVQTTRSSQELQIQLQDMENAVTESSKCNRAAVGEKYTEERKKLEVHKEEYRQIKSNTDVLGKMLMVREKKFMDILKHTQNSIDLAFGVTLNGNGFTGRLIFGKNKTLQLKAWAKAEKSKPEGRNNCSSLSGGERSFITISFLLSMWDRIKMPFRILDEYDVFMDSNNRHLSVNLLIRKAEFNSNVQYIFLSPLELPDMRPSENIKVHKMPPPTRMGLTSAMEED